MANTFLFFQNRNYGVVNNESQSSIISFDLILNEGHNFNSSVSRYNVEDGADISDHIQNDLENGTVSGLITNFSLYDGVLINNKAQEVYDTLRDLWKSKILVDIYTVLQVYEQVAITNISVNRDQSSGESLVCDFSFQEFNKVKLQEIVVTLAVNLKNMKTVQNRQSATNKNVGKTQGETKTLTF